MATRNEQFQQMFARHTLAAYQRQVKSALVVTVALALVRALDHYVVGFALPVVVSHLFLATVIVGLLVGIAHVFSDMDDSGATGVVAGICRHLLTSFPRTGAFVGRMLQGFVHECTAPYYDRQRQLVNGVVAVLLVVLFADALVPLMLDARLVMESIGTMAMLPIMAVLLAPTNLATIIAIASTLAFQAIVAQAEITDAAIALSQMHFGGWLHVLYTCFLSYQIFERQNRQEEALVELLEQADSMNRAKDNFVASLSHELRNPMHALLGSLHLFRDANPSRDQVDLVDTAEDCVTTLSDVINNVLDASKLAAKKIVLDETLNHLPTLFLRIRNVYQLSCRSQGLKFVFHELAPLPDYEVYCDHKSLTHLINNLLANALKMTKKGEVIMTVNWSEDGEATPPPPSQDNDRLRYFEESIATFASSASSVNQPSNYSNLIGGRLTVSIADTGPGISAGSKHSVDTMFEGQDPFSAPEHGQATLGLFVCCKTVELMQGSIRVSNRTPAGTEFVVRLPLKVPKQRARM